MLVTAMRAAKPNVVLHVRDGGVWHDYVEPNDHSEAIVGAILGLPYASAGDKFEVPGTLGDQWAYDPHANYKSAPTVLRDLIPIVAKGGNYLMNIGLDSTGVWAPAALTTLANLTSWLAFAGEAVNGTQPMWPYSYAGFFTQSADASASYVLFWNPGSSSREHRAPPKRRGGAARGVSFPRYTQGYDAATGADALAVLLPLLQALHAAQHAEGRLAPHVHRRGGRAVGAQRGGLRGKPDGRHARRGRSAHNLLPRD